MENKKTHSAIVAYVPVVHAGYLELFKKHPAADLIVLDKKLLEGEFRSIQKDIRALESVQIVETLRVLFPERKISLVQNRTDFQALNAYREIILSEDEISEWLAKEFLSGQEVKIIRDTIFLRWSEAKIKQAQDVTPDEVVTSDELHQVLMGQVMVETQKSSDWWRQTAAAVARDGELVAIAHNTHKPVDQNQYILGDPRANSSRGLALEVSTALHAEEAVIAAAAKQGISLVGADLYVTTFPCPFCARLIAYSGIKRVFYKEGYSVLDGAELMRGQGVELVRVKED